MVLLKVVLPAVDSSVKFASTCATIVGEGQVEAWGSAFERHVELLLRLREKAEGGSPLRPSAADEKGAQKSSGADAFTSQRSASKRVVKLSEEDLETNWYELLKLPNEDGSSAEEIRTAYRRRCLETHPDKQPNKSDEMFKKVTRAFEILGDPDARRAYDSSRPFDDAIPGEEVKEEAFYSSFGPVFERNKKWSSVPHMPSIGDSATPLKQILKFYDAWMQFRSWRDFSHEAELEEIDEGMCREEKRFYQRENERLLERLRKAEQKRVRTLVERAQKNDPRLRKIREDEIREREREKREREEERQRLRAEEARRRDELAQKDREEQEERRRKIVEAKNAVKNCLQKTQELVASKGLLDTVETNMLVPNLIRSPNIKWLYSNCNASDAEALLSRLLECGDGDLVSTFNALVEQREQEVGVTRYGEPLKKKASAPVSAPSATSSSSAVVWSEDDIQLITKAIAKFPGGTVDRWRKIATMMKNKYTEEEVLTMTKKLEGQPLSKASTATAGCGGSSPVPEGGAPPAPAIAAVNSAEDWTAKQQKQLEAGLRQLKDYKEKDKFQKIAESVEGKTARQCFDRYKFLCALNKK
jgi:DnaJ family protein C protein 2